MSTAFQAPRFPIDPRYIGAGLSLGVAAAILSQIPGLEMPHFDIDAVTPDLSLTPDVATPDTASTTIEGLNISFSGEEVAPADRQMIVEALKEAGLVPPTGEAYNVMVLPPETLAEIVNIFGAVNNGVPIEKIRETTSKDALAFFDSIGHQYHQGKNLFVTDRQASFGLRIFPGEKVKYFNIGVNH